MAGGKRRTECIKVGYRVSELILGVRRRWRGGMSEKCGMARGTDPPYNKNFFDGGKVVIYFDPTMGEVTKIHGDFIENEPPYTEHFRKWEGEAARRLWHSVS